MPGVRLSAIDAALLDRLRERRSSENLEAGSIAYAVSRLTPTTDLPRELGSAGWLLALPKTRALAAFLGTVEKHIAAEAGSLGAYRALAGRCGDPIVREILQLILDDEEHHHALLLRIASRLRADLALGPAPSAAVAEPPDSGTATLGLPDVTRALIREERDGARELWRLAKRHRDALDGLVGVLFETMARDSEKHERLLKFVVRRLEN